MSITQVTPEISELTEERTIAIEEACEHHKVPFGALRVDAFHEGALIREAVAQYWRPEYGFKTDDGWEDSKLSQIMWNVAPQGLLQCLEREPGAGDFLVEIRIILTYPLQHAWEATARVPANRLGEVFAIAHDMYRHVYDLDEAEWQSKGHQDAAPRGAPKLLNRASGKYVWGHDMGDLVFEYIEFMADPEWPTIKKKKMQIFDCTDGDLERMRNPPEPEYEDVLAPLTAEEHGSSCPFLGTIAFGIGS